MKYIAPPKTGPKVLIFDIETAPIVGLVWGMHDQNLGVNQIIKRRSVLSFAAKWLGVDGVMFAGTGGQRDVRDDKAIMKKLWSLMDEADVILGQNSNKFDEPIVRGRFAVHKLGNPSPYRRLDTCVMGRRLGLESSKLENMTEVFCPELKKSIHKSFPGMTLWTECLENNKKAWAEMEAYNCQDVLGTEGVYKAIAPYSKTINFDVYREGTVTTCNCGSTNLHNKGYVYTDNAKYRAYRCRDCHAYIKSKANLLSKDKRKSLKKPA